MNHANGKSLVAIPKLIVVLDHPLPIFGVEVPLGVVRMLKAARQVENQIWCRTIGRFPGNDGTETGGIFR